MKVEKLLPEVYYSQSRDFSYVGRLFEILFNYMKTGADCIAVNPTSPNIDATTIELAALTLGFESKHKYTTRDLIYIISSFSDLIRKKGTKYAISTAIRLLMNSQKIYLEEDITDFVSTMFLEEANSFIFDIIIPEQLTDLILLEDIFDYILPAGVLYRFIKVTVQPERETNTGMEVDKSFASMINEDTSELLYDKDGGYVYVKLVDIVAPEDWENGSNFYYFDNNGFNKNSAGTVYAANSFYRKERNLDIGTIITGTVYNGNIY